MMLEHRGKHTVIDDATVIVSGDVVEVAVATERDIQIAAWWTSDARSQSA